MTDDVSPEFIDLLTQHQTRLQSYIASLLANQESTWDVLQETNRVLIEKRGDFAPGTSFVNWSLTVAQFQAMAWLRDQKRDRHILTPELMDVFSDDQDFNLWSSRDYRLSALEDCLQTLSSPHQDLIRSRYSRAESLSEISDRTTRSVNSLKQSFFRIRKRLSSCIEQRLQTQ